MRGKYSMNTLVIKFGTAINPMNYSELLKHNGPTYICDFSGVFTPCVIDLNALPGVIRCHKA